MLISQMWKLGPRRALNLIIRCGTVGSCQPIQPLFYSQTNLYLKYHTNDSWRWDSLIAGIDSFHKTLAGQSSFLLLLLGMGSGWVILNEGVKKDARVTVCLKLELFLFSCRRWKYPWCWGSSGSKGCSWSRPSLSTSLSTKSLSSSSKTPDSFNLPSPAPGGWARLHPVGGKSPPDNICSPHWGVDGWQQALQTGAKVTYKHHVLFYTR